MLMPIGIGSAANALPAAMMSSGDKASEANRFIPVSCFLILESASAGDFDPTAAVETEQYCLVMLRYRNDQGKRILRFPFTTKPSTRGCYRFRHYEIATLA
jgi:hypothetical protein